MVLRVKPTATWFPTNSFYTPHHTLLHTILREYHSWGWMISLATRTGHAS